MLISLTTLLTNLSSSFYSRAALQLENLALRHQIGVLQRCIRNRPKLTLVDRLFMGLAVPHLERLALGAGHHPARNGGGLASQGLSSFLDLEGTNFQDLILAFSLARCYGPLRTMLR
jgi:hypothetical protein